MDELPIHKRRFLVRQQLYEILVEVARDRASEPAEEVNRALREMFEREGRWPPVKGAVAERDPEKRAG